MAIASSPIELVRIDETLWEIPVDARPDMRVPGRIFADRELLDAIVRDRSLEQLQNVATLPGIVEAALAMPDIHQGYGFPVGGVAAMELPDGVVSPGGVGYPFGQLRSTWESPEPDQGIAGCWGGRAVRPSTVTEERR